MREEVARSFLFRIRGDEERSAAREDKRGDKAEEPDGCEETRGRATGLTG